MTRRNVVAAVVSNYLCCGCGTCVAVCPTDALAMTETAAGLLTAQMTPEEACTGCGLCLRTCPGAILTDESEQAFDALPDPFVGSIVDAYWGWAQAPRTRQDGASGGVVTALVEHLLRTATVQAALLTRWSPDDPLKHEAFIAHAPEDLGRSQRSRYCPVALNERLRELMQFERIAVVGLPCQLHGIDHFARLLGDGFPDIIRVGLFCERTLSPLIVDRLIEIAGAKTPIRQFEYRHKGEHGWPGDVYVQDGGGNAVFIDRDERMRRKDLYTPARCRLCFDKLNVLADIACGDGYGAPYAEEGSPQCWFAQGGVDAS